jgi:alpha-1,6-mannosyltransferase
MLTTATVALGSIRGSRYLCGVANVERCRRHDAGALRRLLRPVPLHLSAATGFFGILGVLLGVTQGGSPFALKVSGAWFFGTGSHGASSPGEGTFLGIMLVYAGVALLIGSWMEIVRTLRRRPGTTLGVTVRILALWALPILVMPPLFSRDVYSYAAQGEMVGRGVNPYLHGPSVLEPSRFLEFVDPLWRNARAPYGPAWERLSGAIVQLGHHDVLATIVGFRLAALLGVVLMAWGIPVLARSAGRDRTSAFALAVLNPLVLLVLLGGAHNDALMLGLLVAGCALARSNHPLLGVVLCVLAAEIKVPALIGAAFIGWWWSDGAPAWRQRVPRITAALLLAVALVAAIGAVAGLGWRWLSGLSSPGVVVSWLDPATAIGLTLSHLSELFGYGHHSVAFVQVCRAVGLVLAAVVSAALIWRSERIGSIRALGVSLLLFAVLGPVVWPWYEAWGIVFLAVVAERWTLRLVVALSAIACFADVPGANLLGAGSPPLAAICWACLLGVIIFYIDRRVIPSLLPGPKQ